MNRGTTLIRLQSRHLSCSVTGAPVPVIPGCLEVAGRFVHKGLAPFPSRLVGGFLPRFRIAFAYPHIFYHKRGICQWFSSEKPTYSAQASPCRDVARGRKFIRPVLPAMLSWQVCPLRSWGRSSPLQFRFFHSRRYHANTWR